MSCQATLLLFLFLNYPVFFQYPLLLVLFHQKMSQLKTFQAQMACIVFISIYSPKGPGVEAEPGMKGVVSSPSSSLPSCQCDSSGSKAGFSKTPSAITIYMSTIVCFFKLGEYSSVCNKSSSKKKCLCQRNFAQRIAKRLYALRFALTSTFRTSFFEAKTERTWCLGECKVKTYARSTLTRRQENLGRRR